MIISIVFLSLLFGISCPLLAVRIVKEHRHKIVRKTSAKTKAVNELNNKYTFENPKTDWNYTFHCNSLRKFRRMDTNDLENAFFDEHYPEALNSLEQLSQNRKEYEKYMSEYNSIVENETIVPESIKLKPEVYAKYENKILKQLKKTISKGLNIRMVFEYTSPAGMNHYVSDTHRLHFDNINEESVDDFTKRFNSPLRTLRLESRQDMPINSNSYVSPQPPLNMGHTNETPTKCDIDVTLHIKISILNKLMYFFDFIDKDNGKRYAYYSFLEKANEKLIKKVLETRELLKDIHYIEDPEKMLDFLNHIKEVVTDSENFHLKMKNITLEMIKELDSKLNVSFKLDFSGNVCIDQIQIGLAEDFNAYVENNPNSIFVDALNWIQTNLDEINSTSKNKVASLYKFINQSTNDRLRFSLNEHLEIRIYIDINAERMVATTVPHYFYCGNEIDRSKAKGLVFDKTLFLACDSFLKEVKYVNDYYSSDFKKLVKRLISLRERFKDNDRIKYVFSDIIRNSEEWIRHFNLRPDVEPLVLDNLKEGTLVCDEKLSSVMRDYQKYAFDWANKLVSNQLSGILADDMGLGKTLEIISILHADKTNLPNLIVCPVSLLHNWENEFHKWCPDEETTVKRYFSAELFRDNSNFNRKINYIVSYDFMIRYTNELKQHRFNYIILDEAQYIKNSYTNRSKHAKMLVANHRFALTGTPLENSEDDLVNIFDFVMPSLNAEYKLKYLSRSVQREYIAPFLLRRRKADVLNELPDKNTIIVELDMTDEQRSIYDTYKANQADINDEYLAILALLTRLRQICVCPQMVVPSCNSDSVKINYMFDLIDQIIESGESVLIYSFFASVFDYIEPLMKQRNVKYVRLDGGVNPDARAEIIDKFDKEDDIHCFLLSLKAGGVGLNLTKANNVIFLDPWWNIAVENQASDRTHRIGQTKKVTIYRLICKDTIEEKVLDIQKEKLDLINFFVESQGEDPLGKLTIEMMRDLLK